MPAWMKEGDDAGAGEQAPMSLPRSRDVFQEDANKLPPGWAEAAAPNGRKYWYNTSTNETTWERPGVATEDAPEPTGAVSVDAAKTPQSARQPDGQPWREAVGAEGRVYYYNSVTGETTYNKPSALGGPAEGRQEQPPTQATNTYPPSGSAASNEDDITDGWIEYKTPEGKSYYHNSATNETQWTKPTKSTAQKMAPSSEDNASKAQMTNDRRTPSGTSEAVTSEEPAEGWKEYETKDGRKYYHNVRTGVTQWTKPEALGGDSELQPSTGKRGGVSGRGSRRKIGVQRPRNEKGKPLQDKQAEQYFIVEAERKRKKNVNVDYFDPENMDLHEKYELFKKMLEENGITGQHRWLETMKICTADPRYKVLSKYGLRHDAFVKYKAQAQKRERIEKVLQFRKARDDFMEMLEEHLHDSEDKARSLEDLPVEKVRLVEIDSRYKAIEDADERKDMVRGYFIDRERKLREASRRKRKEAMASFLKALEEESQGASPRIHERTSFREVCDIFANHEAYKALDDADRSSIYETWQKDLEARVVEARMKEKEKKRASEREKRAAFRRGVEELILSKTIDLTMKWKAAEAIIKEQPWYTALQEQDARASDLYADVVKAVEDKILSHKDKFKSILKEKDLQVAHSSKFEDIWSTAKDELEAAGINEVYAMDLFDRQREKAISAKKKEEKRIEKIKIDFWDLLRRKDIGPESTWKDAKSVVSARSAYKDLVAIGGDSLAQKAFQEYVAHRKERGEKREKREKRQREFEGDQKPPVNGERGDAKSEAERIESVTKKRKEDSNQAAVENKRSGDLEEGEV
eukprot:CAMPEP_0198736292 /NCGR_PEP_ID=MMETSP1475-20131203/64729_1 /TAXON_ID= ORGANISM="Unidentified sp., Strain CCMP1999" /NCGR_SAMPLE_ID=MMETSP1475 /ASSEMBLY_ACC=CAM_ASM_001111 /LENGTH=806 /DNA_ID=CAMNT_0044500073 /DNA_START=65 /DNA_END=2485 /DNA_ORIENTATION=-